MKYLYLFIALISTASLSAQQSTNELDVHFIEVKGKAELEIVPDEIYIGVTIKETDSKGKEQIDELENKMINTLKEIGLDVGKCLKVKDLSSIFINSFLGKDQIKISKQYEILVSNAKTADNVITDLKEVGISNIGISRIDHSKIKEYQKEVRIDAIKAAREKAGYLLEAIDQELGQVILVREVSSHFHMNLTKQIPMSNSYKSLGLNYSSNKNHIIEFETIKLEYSVLCKFEIKDLL